VQLRFLGSEDIPHPAEEAEEQSERRMPYQELLHEQEGAVDHHPDRLALVADGVLDLHLRLASYTDA
jgi:hypothetical protein